MKRFTKAIFIFAIIVIIVDIGYGMVCDYLYSHSQGGVTKLSWQTCKEQTSDVLVMGSSRANHHYVPTILSDSLGMSVYNAGQDGNGIVLMYGYYEIIKERYLPKVIIYEVTQAFDIDEYAEDDHCKRYLGSLRPYHSNNGVKGIFRRVDRSELIKNHSGLYRYNSKGLDIIKEYVTRPAFPLDGFVPLSGEIKEGYVIKPEKGGQKIDTLKLSFLRDFIMEVKSDNVKIILVASPKFGVKSSESFEPVKKIAKELEVDFIDLYSDPDFVNNRELFKEPMHLNVLGSEYYSAKFANIIKGLI